MIDAGNPNPRRDGAIAEATRLPRVPASRLRSICQARACCAFNQLNNKVFLSQAHRAGEGCGAARRQR